MIIEIVNTPTTLPACGVSPSFSKVQCTRHEGHDGPHVHESDEVGRVSWVPHSERWRRDEEFGG